MIIGNGDIAGVIQDRPHWLFFASGVSNSQETSREAFSREEKLLKEQPHTYHGVYFSTMSVFYADTRYTEHKRRMEVMFKSHFPHYTIVRLGNITWGDNPHTLLNFLRNQLRNGERIDVQPVERYICDLEEFRHWMALLPQFNCEVNIPGRRMAVREIVDEIIQEAVCQMT